MTTTTYTRHDEIMLDGGKATFIALTPAPEVCGGELLLLPLQIELATTRDIKMNERNKFMEAERNVMHVFQCLEILHNILIYIDVYPAART
jgi:hypothetical protein